MGLIFKPQLEVLKLLQFSGCISNTVTQHVCSFLMLCLNSMHTLLIWAKIKPTTGLARQPFLLTPPLDKTSLVSKRLGTIVLVLQPLPPPTFSTQHSSYANIVLVRTYCIQVTVFSTFLASSIYSRGRGYYYNNFTNIDTQRKVNLPLPS